MASAGGVSSSAWGQTTTFAQFLQSTTGNPFSFSNNGTNATFSTTNLPVDFRYSPGLFAGLSSDLQGFQSARLTLTAGTTQSATSSTSSTGVDLAQPFNAPLETLSITRTSPASSGNGTRTNLLTISFSGILSGQSGASSANLNASTGGGDTVTFSSDFLDFSQTTIRDMTLAFTSLNPALGLGTANGGLQFLQSFVAAGTGTFSSNPVPTVVVPEPTTTALLLGLAPLGLVVLRARRRRLLAA